MNARALFTWLILGGTAIAAASCSNAPSWSSAPFEALPQTRSPARVRTPSPPPGHLYVDHNGRFYEYKLPLKKTSKPSVSLNELAGSAFPPQIAADAYGNVAIVTPAEIRLFRKPIRSFARSAAHTIVSLTPAITQIGQSGADVVDAQFDPNGDLWLLSGLGGEISELRAPFTKSMVASIAIAFGAPGTKTASYGPLQMRFDVNATLYVYAQSATTGQLFSTQFPYAKPLSPTNLNVAQAGFVDSSQYANSNPNPIPVILGQYNGSLSSPPPGQVPPPPVDMLSQFAVPLNPVAGLFPDATVNTIVGALIADPIVTQFFTLRNSDGRLDVFKLPMTKNAKPLLVLRCLAGAAKCNNKPEHLFLAP